DPGAMARARRRPRLWHRGTAAQRDSDGHLCRHRRGRRAAAGWRRRRPPHDCRGRCILGCLMLLAIDSGNTNIVFAVFDGDTLRGEWRAASDARRTADEYGIWLAELIKLADLRRDEVESSIIATVVPDTLFNLKSLCRKYFRTDPLIIGDPGVKLGIEVLVDTPEEVGADRLVNAVGAQARHGGPLIVI